VKRDTARAITLDDKYTVTRGRIYLNGVQALVRLPLLQKDLDRRAGLNTAGYITGYRGSPLSGLDAELEGERARLEANDIVFRPGTNEDLAMTAIWGTQLLKALPGPKFDGVFAYWYAKGPGVDRSGDPMKHGNHQGTNANGGVLIVYGDDHPGKSSTISHQSEQALAANLLPSLYPCGVAEFIEFGLKGWAMSRYAGLWIGFKTVNETIEQTATVEIDLDGLRIDRPDRGELAPGTVNIESGELVWPPVRHEIAINSVRFPLLHRFVRANGIDKTPITSSRPRLGIVTAGKAYMDVLQAFQMLGIDSSRADELGISVYKVGLIWPVEPEGLREFAQRQETLLFVEEKKSFVEDQAAKVLYNEAVRPRIVGKVDEDGAKLLPSDIQLDPAAIAIAIVGRLEKLGIDDETIRARVAELRPMLERPPELPAAVRSPYFCSGCPHNTSTKVPDGSYAMSGIGCHTMVVFTRRETLPPSQMGGEGGQWVSLEHFTETPHIFQNLGDGTYFHSGIMSIRNSVAAGSNITYKILYNDAVAMTGGQPVDGTLSVGRIASQALAEGVAEVVIVSDDPERHASSTDIPEGLTVQHRDRLDEIQRRLRAVPGCTVIIYEQTCAAEKRRRRKRGKYPDPAKRMFINEEVCEGCGDCSVQATCVSILPNPTGRGLKRKIDQSSCNKDYSCNKGFCPSFVTVLGGAPRKPEAMRIDEALFDALPRPDMPGLDGSYAIMVAGIGGTGVITVSAILGMAAHIDGKACSIFDMTGLAQKNGAVYSHLKIANSGTSIGAQRIGLGEANLLMAFDMVAGIADEAYRTLAPLRSRVLANSSVQPTIGFQFNPQARVDERLLVDRIRLRVGDERASIVDANGMALALTGDAIATNMFMVGYALQRGLLPLTLDAVLRAIELNGVAVSFNRKALQLGRLYAADAPALERYLPAGGDEVPAETPQRLDDVTRQGVDWLTAYQDAAWAARYRNFVDEISAAEQAVSPGASMLAIAVARNLAKLMAYKDEYEVARLHSDPAFMDRLRAQFDGEFTLRFNLAPPLFARRDPVSGHLQKREYGPWMMTAFRALARLRALRGTAFDLFGRTAERRMERQLIDDYIALLREVARELTVDNHQTAAQIASLPELVSGFGHVKERNVALMRKRRDELLIAFREVPARHAKTGT